MKNSVYLLATAGVLAVASCATKMDETADSGYQTVTFTAVHEGGSETRTVLDEDFTHVLWTPGDKINLFYQDQNACFVSTNEYEKTAIAQFFGDLKISVVTGGNEDSGMETSCFWGLYPYSEEAAYHAEKGFIETTLPYEQVAAENSFADDLFITIGRSTSWSMPFYNVCSGLRFTVDQEGIQTVILRSNDGSPLAGRFLVGFDPETGRPAVQEFEQSFDEISLVPPDGDCFHPGVYYYIVTLPGTHHAGITLELEGLSYPASVTTNSPVTFLRSNFLSTELTVERYCQDFPLESIDLDIENEGVKRYLAEVDYSGDLVSYNESYIDKYLSMGTDKPSPVTFHWKSSGNRQMVVYEAGMGGKIVFEGDASGESTEIYNLIPGMEYTYSVSGDFEWTSSFTPQGTLRMMDVDGVRNVRDLGGWKAEGGSTIAYGHLYRGAELNNISEYGREVALNTMSVAADIDLRGGNDNVLGLQNYSSYRVTLFNISDTSGKLYADSIKQIIRLLCNGQVVYFHCMVGADRTGTLAFLLEALLGVSEGDLSKDFELTSFYERRTRNGNSTFSLRPQLIPTIKGYTGDTIQEKVTTWAIENSVTQEEINALKNVLLVPPTIVDQ